MQANCVKESGSGGGAMGTCTGFLLDVSTDIWQTRNTNGKTFVPLKLTFP